VPAALLISAIAPWAVTPLLMIGGAYLCYEGFEKVAHHLLHSKSEDAAAHAELVKALEDPAIDVVAFEKAKIRGAIRTDFILSAEIIVISLGTVAEAEFLTRVTVMAAIALLMTVGVYGLVAGIVKLDDLGLYLAKKSSRLLRLIGSGLVSAAPWLMKSLSVVGTVAMFLVGGGILVHGLPVAALHHLAEGPWSLLVSLVTGMAAGAVVLAGDKLLRKLISR
jgi:predicted DNA repair protein MutK